MTRDQKIQDLKEKIRNWDVPRLGFAGKRRLEFILNDLLNNSN